MSLEPTKSRAHHCYGRAIVSSLLSATAAVRRRTRCIRVASRPPVDVHIDQHEVGRRLDLHKVKAILEVVMSK